MLVTVPVFTQPGQQPLESGDSAAPVSETFLCLTAGLMGHPCRKAWDMLAFCSALEAGLNLNSGCVTYTSGLQSLFSL